MNAPTTSASSSIKNATVIGEQEQNQPGCEDFPVFPPPTPQEILDNRAEYWTRLKARKFAAPRGVLKDTSLFALYRLYEYILVDQVRPYRDALEAFWRVESWVVRDIPDPEDPDPARYAFLAGCTYLLVRCFNERVKLGLRRDMPSLLTTDEAEELKNVPVHLREYEEVPDWAVKAAPVEDLLSIPTEDGTTLDGRDDERADVDFLAKNILLWTPHIYFT